MFTNHRRYYCVNTTNGCRYALSDHPYIRTTLDQSEALCSGTSGDGCGAPLVLGTTQNRTPLLVGSALGVIALTVAFTFHLRSIVAPLPLNDIAFSSQITEVTEDQKLAEIEIVRQDASEPKTVRFRTVDGKAQSKLDFEEAAGEVVFGQGETTKTITIPIFPDDNYQEGVENFSVELTNVQHVPKHVVFIAEPHRTVESYQAAETLVRSMSVIANDIGAFYVKEKSLRKLLALNLTDKPYYERIQSSLTNVESRFRDARERYGQLFRELDKLDNGLIFSAIDNWVASLERQHIEQQRAATLIMKQQIQGYYTFRIIEMDTWSKQLSAIIPTVEAPPTKSAQLNL